MIGLIEIQLYFPIELKQSSNIILCVVKHKHWPTLTVHDLTPELIKGKYTVVSRDRMPMKQSNDRFHSEKTYDNAEGIYFEGAARVNSSFLLIYSIKYFQELEKIAPKEKGIIAQSVKDVVQSLVDDGLVDTDKIGTSIYFWSFPR